MARVGYSLREVRSCAVGDVRVCREGAPRKAPGMIPCGLLEILVYVGAYGVSWLSPQYHGEPKRKTLILVSNGEKCVRGVMIDADKW